jgi:hypothetical protein
VSEIVSRVYQPNPAYCCERCVFGRGQHAEWCQAGIDFQVMQLFLASLPEQRRQQILRSL